jgi:hypothetical protein
MTLPPLTAFAAWLADRPPLTVVGERWSPTNCPLAQWLESWTGRCVAVDTTTLSIQAWAGSAVWTCVPMPADYQRYGVLLDAAPATVPRHVTACEAQAVLARVRGEG